MPCCLKRLEGSEGSAGCDVKQTNHTHEHSRGAMTTQPGPLPLQSVDYSGLGTKYLDYLQVPTMWYMGGQ